MSNHYQIAIIGAGPGGYVAALKAAALGASVAVVEKHHLGGTCLNYGCIPSKALLSSAELLYQLQHSDQWGLAAGQVAFDWSKIQARKDKVLAANRSGIASLFKGRNVALFQGRGKLDGANRIAVLSDSSAPRIITADAVILATGSAPVRIPGWPTDPSMVCTSDEAVHWAKLPKRLLIVGGGVIGCEFACMMQAYGVQTTVVEMMPRLLPGLDYELGEALAAIFRKRGIAVHTDVRVDELKLFDGQVEARLSNGTTVKADRVLVSVGRRPNSTELGLESAGIEAGGKGFIRVDDTMQTNIRGHYCIGDVNGKVLLAHAASAQGVVAVENALGQRKTFDAPVPGAVYTFPEIGSVGMTEQEAHEKNVPISIGKFPLSRLGKAMACNHTEGFVKMIRHRETGQLLGAHMLAHNATECIAAAAALLHQKVSMKDVAETVWAHPTISEAIKEAAEDAMGMALHLPPRKVFRMPALV